VLQVEGVLEAHADMTEHEVAVTLAGPEVPVSGVIRALNDAGFTVGAPRMLQEIRP